MTQERSSPGKEQGRQEEIITGTIRDGTRIHRILDQLFTMYGQSEKLQRHLESHFAGKDRSLLLTIIKQSLRGMDIHESASITQIEPEAIHFGIRIHNRELQKWMPDDLAEFTVQCIMDQDTFIDILIGRNKFGLPFSIDYAWCCKEIVFIGEDWYLHKTLATELFEEFRYLLNLKTILTWK